MIYPAKIAAQMVDGGHHTAINAVIFSAIAAEAFPNEFVGWCTLIMSFKQKYEKHIAASDLPPKLVPPKMSELRTSAIC